MTRTAAIIASLDECNAELLRYLRELEAQRRRRDFYVVTGGKGEGG